MNRKWLMTTLATGVVGILALGNGCYSYTPAPEGQTGTTFTERKLAESDKILSDIKVLTLKQAQEIAVMNNPTYISAYHAVNAARMSYYQALGAFSPTVSASFTMSRPESTYFNRHGNQANSNSFTTATGVQASWLIFDGFSRYFAAMAAKHQYEYQVDMEENSRRLLMQAVAYAYNDILLSIAQRNIALNNRQFQETNLDAAKSKLSVGAVSLSEPINFQIGINDAINSQMQAEYNYDLALYNLAVLMGYSEGVLPGNIQFEDIEIDLDAPISNIDVYLDAALNNRPDLAGYREQMEIAKYNLYDTYSAFSPTLTGTINYSFNTNKSHSYDYREHGTYYAFESENYYNRNDFSYGLQADWVLFNGGQRYNSMRNAQALYAASEFDLAQGWLNVVQEVRNAYANYVYSIKQARVYAMTLSLVDKQRELVQIEYDAGTVAITRLNEAQTDYVDAAMNHATALINIQNAKAELIAAVNIDSTGYNFLDRYKEFERHEEEMAEILTEEAMTENSNSEPAAE